MNEAEAQGIQEFASTEQAQGWIDTLAAAGVPLGFIGALVFLGATLLLLRYFGLLRNGGTDREWLSGQVTNLHNKLDTNHAVVIENLGELGERMAHVEGRLGVERTARGPKAVR